MFYFPTKKDTGVLTHMEGYMCAVDAENEVHKSVGAVFLARVSIGGRTDLVFVNGTLT